MATRCPSFPNKLWEERISLIYTIPNSFWSLLFWTESICSIWVFYYYWCCWSLVVPGGTVRLILFIYFKKKNTDSLQSVSLWLPWLKAAAQAVALMPHEARFPYVRPSPYIPERKTCKYGHLVTRTTYTQAERIPRVVTLDRLVQSLWGPGVQLQFL